MGGAKESRQAIGIYYEMGVYHEASTYRMKNCFDYNLSFDLAYRMRSYNILQTAFSILHVLFEHVI